MRKLIAFDDDTFDKLKQLARDRIATFQELADEAFADLFEKAWHSDRPERRLAQKREACVGAGQEKQVAEGVAKSQIVMVRMPAPPWCPDSEVRSILRSHVSNFGIERTLANLLI